VSATNDQNLRMLNKELVVTVDLNADRRCRPEFRQSQGLHRLSGGHLNLLRPILCFDELLQEAVNTDACLEAAATVDSCVAVTATSLVINE
jgi:hypothetical protein